MKTNDVRHALLAALLLTSLDVGAETQYPPDFEPVIVYQDAEYIAAHGAVTEKPGITQSSTSRVDLAHADKKPNKSVANTAGGPFMQDYLIIGIAILGLFGLYWLTSRQGSKAGETDIAETDIDAIEGETSVARYLRRLEASSQKKTSA